MAEEDEKPTTDEVKSPEMSEKPKTGVKSRLRNAEKFLSKKGLWLLIKIVAIFIGITICISIVSGRTGWHIGGLIYIIILLAIIRKIWGERHRLAWPFSLAIFLLLIAVVFEKQEEKPTKVKLPAGGIGATVAVPANHPFWTKAGITFSPGDSVLIKASGMIFWDWSAAVLYDQGWVDPEGASWTPKEIIRPEEFLLPDFAVAGLIGRIGEGEPFGIGQEKRIKIKRGGPLKLAINERWLKPCYKSNKGKFIVTVIKHPS